ncbi:hypothetical protein M514_03983 [Trichuris suis]|uniref:Uncharacterized protein n=1 Tax=Trichuris suis TaxID=68888 RepID=A0A085MCW9_9BILA|nr:hypothetical protein M513_03983 [Trichuris suis]KFD72577.1 hypothetical protein M514_03983 [Trichuris suis]
MKLVNFMNGHVKLKFDFGSLSLSATGELCFAHIYKLDAVVVAKQYTTPICAMAKTSYALSTSP